MTVMATTTFEAWCDNGRCGAHLDPKETVADAVEAASSAGWLMSMPFGMLCRACAVDLGFRPASTLRNLEADR